MFIKKLIIILSCMGYLSLMAAPKISIITSVYDGDEFIEGFLEDIVQQTIFEQCELIIINAASPGNEESIIQQYMANFPNILYQRLDHDPGLYAVWNNALTRARGTYITNANIDDRLAPTCYEVHAAYLDAHPHVDLVYSDKYITYKKNETFASHTGVQWAPSPSATCESMSQCWPGSNPMWRASLHTRFGFFDATYKCSGDWEMWLRAMQGGACLQKIPGYYLLYYHNPHGLSTGKYTTQKQAEDAKIIEHYGCMWAAETYKTYYTIARMLDIQHKESPHVWPLAMNFYLKAYALKPHRAEPLIRIAQYYATRGEPALAYIFASKAVSMDCPSDREFVEQDLYDYDRYDILGQAAWYVNEFNEGEEALRILIKKYPTMPHVQRNLDFYVRRKQG